MMVSENIKQHFRPDEVPFIDSMMSLINTASGQYRPVLTDFLNPRQRYILQTLVNQEDQLRMQSSGGYETAEMQRSLIYPDYFQPTPADFKLQLIEINYPVKFVELHHRQIMGSLLGSGIKRETFGDILNEGNRWQFFIKNELTQYVGAQVDRIGRNHVQLMTVDLDHLVHPADDWEPLETTVSSLRLDAVISTAFNYSRNRSKELVEHGLVRVNWEEMDRPDYELAVHDQISVRHAGRIKLTALNGKNKKQKLRTTLMVINAWCLEDK